MFKLWGPGHPLNHTDPSGEAAVAVAPLLALLATLFAAYFILAFNPAAQQAIGQAISSLLILIQSLTAPVTGPANSSPTSQGGQTNVTQTETASPQLTGPYIINQQQDLSQTTVNLSSSGKTTIVDKPGDFEQAKQDFEALNPTNVQERPNGTITGELANGDKINVRPTSSDGRPTLEVQHKSGDVTKTRYGNKSD